MLKNRPYGARPDNQTFARAKRVGPGSEIKEQEPWTGLILAGRRLVRCRQGRVASIPKKGS